MALSDLPHLKHQRNVVAHYLPQFHSIPENDEWYGDGFTEWTNVRRGKALTIRHRPIQPGELGWYNLDTDEVMYRQNELAKRYGVTGFAIWHYWFGGRRVLEKPAERLLSDTSLPLNFCFFWANETWKGSWYGAPRKTLITQDYPPGDAARHFEALTPFLQDPRYIRLNGRPLVGIYRPAQIPEIERYIDTWRTRSQQLGLGDLFVLGQGEALDPAPSCCDASWTNPLMFAPQSSPIPRQLCHTLRHPWAIDAVKLQKKLDNFYRQNPQRTIGTVMPNWDNTPRAHRRGSYLIRNSVQTFEQQCESALALDDRRVANGLDSLVLVKSWNEWAEGNSLEPSEQFEHGFGDALARSVSAAGRASELRPNSPERIRT